jgi:nucleotide-binding universal stress UspA family protein
MTRVAKILVGVDFDEASAAALKTAASLAAAWGAELTVFHSATDAVPAYFTASQIDALEAEREQRRATVADQIRAFAGPHAPAAFEVVVGEGPPQDAVLRAAPAFDLVAVGTHRRHGAQRWWLGSVAEAIVRRSPRPVLVVPAGATMPDARAPTILAADGHDAAIDTWVDVLRTATGGAVVRSVDIHRCAPDRLQQADLMVLSIPAGASQPQLSAVAHVLKECVHPVLFVPSVDGIAERSSS